MMKTLKSMALVAMAAMALVSCQKNNVAGNEPDGYKNVNFSLGTKASGSTPETTVDNIQISVFDQDCNYVAGGRGSGEQISLKVPVGVDNFLVCAVANGADNNLYKISDLNTLKASRSVLGTSGNFFEMFRIKDKVSLRNNETCTLEVKRFAAKVEIDAIKDSIQYDHTLTINKIYLINVNTNVSFDFTTRKEDMVYKQSGGYKSDENGVTPFTYQTISNSTPLTKDGEYKTVHSFYCYPNPVTSETGNYKFTRLVVEATLDGTLYYYPVNLAGEGFPNGIESNKVYKITQLTIAGPGSKNADTPVTKETLSFHVEVAGWENGASQAVTI